MLRLAVITLLALGIAHAQPWRTAAPPQAAPPANQLAIAGNACGPAALLNAFRFGSANWQQPLVKLPATTDRERMLFIIRHYGGRPSKSLTSQQRWTRRGVNLADLTDIANEMAAPFYLPRLTAAVFFAEKDETPARLLQRTHQQLGKSLSKGFPPILSLRRFAYRKNQWIIVEAHFITLTALPEKLDKTATTFPFHYIDPWGGKRCQGELAIPAHQHPPGLPSNLEMRLPQTSVGRNQLRPGEPSLVVLSAALGRW